MPCCGTTRPRAGWPAGRPVRPACRCTTRTGRRCTGYTGPGASSRTGTAPPRLLLGETWVGDVGRLAAFYGDDDELQLAFNFPFVFAGFTAADLAAVVASTMSALPLGACPVWTASNHDVGRFASRWCGGDDAKIRLALLVLAALPGTLVLYYGDEIGMTDVTVPPELARDLLAGGSPQLGRDRARTPMQWDDSPTGGFTAPGVRELAADRRRGGAQCRRSAPRSGIGALLSAASCSASGVRTLARSWPDTSRCPRRTASGASPPAG